MLLDALFRTYDKIDDLQHSIATLQIDLIVLTAKMKRFQTKKKLRQTVLLSAMEKRLMRKLGEEKRDVEEERRNMARINKEIKKEGGYTHESEDVGYE